MKEIPSFIVVSARVLMAIVFLINGFGIVDQSVAIHEMIARGVPVHLAPEISMAGRIIEILAGAGLALGLRPRLCAAALIAFLIPATLIGHPFWIAPSQLYQVQLVNFLKNLAIVGGLLFVASVGLTKKPA